MSTLTGRKQLHGHGKPHWNPTVATTLFILIIIGLIATYTLTLNRINNSIEVAGIGYTSLEERIDNIYNDLLSVKTDFEKEKSKPTPTQVPTNTNLSSLETDVGALKLQVGIQATQIATLQKTLDNLNSTLVQTRFGVDMQEAADRLGWTIVEKPCSEYGKKDDPLVMYGYQGYVTKEGLTWESSMCFDSLEGWDVKNNDNHFYMVILATRPSTGSCASGPQFFNVKLWQPGASLVSKGFVVTEDKLGATSPEFVNTLIYELAGNRGADTLQTFAFPCASDEKGMDERSVIVRIWPLSMDQFGVLLEDNRFGSFITTPPRNWQYIPGRPH